MLIPDILCCAMLELAVAPKAVFTVLAIMLIASFHVNAQQPPTKSRANQPPAQGQANDAARQTISRNAQDLIAAATKGDSARVKTLLAAKADVKAKDNSGFTALISASGPGYTEIVQALLAAKADVNAKTSQGATALMYASQNGHLDVVQVLLAAKADVNAKLGDGSTASFLAWQGGHTEVVQLLNSKGAAPLEEINVKGNVQVVMSLPDVVRDTGSGMGITFLLTAGSLRYVISVTATTALPSGWLSKVCGDKNVLCGSYLVNGVVLLHPSSGRAGLIVATEIRDDPDTR